MSRLLSSRVPRLMSKWCVEREKQRLFYSNAADFTEICAVEGREAENDFL